jgi:small conductance mechanosensitive channel
VLRAQALEAARRSRRQLLIIAPLIAGIVLAYVFRKELFGADEPVRLAAAGALVVLGWAFASNLGRALQPRLADRFDSATAGVAGFLIRLCTLVAILFASLRIAGLNPAALALGASFTAIIVGLAAQQTFGNLFAGVVLVATRPFSIGERVRFNGYGMDVEGTVAAHGLLYLTLTDDDDVIMVPNSTVLTMSIRPLRQPAAVDMRARLPRTVDPQEIQRRITEGVAVPTKGRPHVALEELDGDEIVVRVRATPIDPHEGGRLAKQVLDAVGALHERVNA